MYRIVYSVPLVIFLSFEAFADMSRDDRDELFSKMEQMCSNADTEVSRYIQFKGEAGAKGFVKLVGGEMSGEVTVKQFENLEQQLNDFRTNPTICKFEAIELLLPIFDRSGGGSSGVLQSNDLRFACEFPKDPRADINPGTGLTLRQRLGVDETAPGNDEKGVDLRALINIGQFGVAIPVAYNELNRASGEFGRYSKESYYYADIYAFALRSLMESDGKDIQYIEGIDPKKALDSLKRNYGAEIGRFGCIERSRPT